MDDRKKFVNKLRRMRSLIECGWTKGAFARDANGYITMSTGPEAVCYCLQGAARRVDLPPWELRGPRGALLNTPQWNDAKGRTQADVLAVIDNSIAALETECHARGGVK